MVRLNILCLCALAALSTVAAACGGDSNINYPPFPNSPGDPDAAPRPDSAPPPPPSNDPVINEIVIDVMGTDVGGLGFIEIFGEPNTDYSALTLVQIDGDNPASNPPAGVITLVITPGTTDANGFWASGAELDADDFQNGSQTWLLVTSFTGALDEDLDTNDDGTLETTPWTTIMDSVAIDDDTVSVTDLWYAGAPVVLRSDSAGDHGGIARRLDGGDSDEASDWVQTALTGVAADNTEANVTQGATNTCDDPPAACP